MTMILTSDLFNRLVSRCNRTHLFCFFFQQEYFEWAAKVVKGLRGTNTKLEEQLDQLFKERNISELIK